MKKFRFLFVAILAMAMVFNTSCEKDPVDDGGDDVTLEEAPELDAPGEGKVTIAVRVPEGTCNGVRGVGSFNGWNDNDETQNFTKVEGTETWYQLTIENDFEESVTLSVKVLGIREDGSSSWDTQWGENWPDKDPEVTFVGDESESAEFEIENDRQPKLNVTAGNQVIYIDIAKWSSEPCAPPVPAGTGKFVFTPTAESVIPEGAVIVFTGNFTENNWGDSERTMTQEGDAYAWEGDYPENFEMKVFVQDGEWMEGGNVKLPVDAEFPFHFEGTIPEAK